MASITTLLNNITGLSYRTTINDNFANVNNELVSTTAAAGTITTDITNLDTRVTTNETAIATHTDEINSLSENNHAISIASGVRAEQTLTPTVAEKLEWMATALVDAGSTSISYDIPNNNILISSAAVYKVYGVVTAILPINDICEIELYIDNLPTGFKTSCIGRGVDSSVTFNYSFMNDFIVNDDINLYVKSTGTSITLQSSSVTIEKTNY